MSFTLALITLLLGSSTVVAFVLQPPREEHASALVSQHRCRGESQQSVRRALLRGLNLQAEPQLPAGGLDSVREQWNSVFSAIYPTANATVSGLSVSADVGNSTGLKCCSMAYEVFMKDLGWDNWVIHPPSVTVVRCVLCNPETDTVQCSSRRHSQDADSQVPRCLPASQQTLPIVYMDDLGTVVISSVQLTRSCACGPGAAE
ncbi:gonadal somatic cell derived factor [Betta splendens]|uniref:Gonadal somatic cell derived factor n=1 Tax=Betta splendens TaxID=158456 RepID=A0A6P7P124_BETSP|nr:gonadal somatic cell derived factor [Betta splendens]